MLTNFLRQTATGLVTIVLLSLTACSGKTTDSAPFLTNIEAERVVNDYAAKNNEANANGDEQRLQQIEGDAMAIIDTAAISIRKNADPKPPPHQSFRLTDNQIVIIEAANYPRSFLAVAHPDVAKDDFDLTLLFQQQSATTPWKMIATIGVEKPQQAPKLRVNQEGHAELVTSPAGLATDPGKVCGALSDYLNADGNGPHVSLFAKDKILAGTLARDAAHKKALQQQGITVERYGYSHREEFPAPILRTAEGGAFTFCALERRARISSPAGFAAGNEAKALLGHGDLVTVMEQTGLGIYGLEIGGSSVTAIGAQGGLIRVTGTKK